MKKAILLCLLLCVFCVSCATQNSVKSPENTAPVAEQQNVDESPTVDESPKNEEVYAPDFNITYLSGESGGKLSDFSDKPVLLNFWATWCGPCVIEMPHFEKIYAEYGDKINILAVNVGENSDTVQKFIDDNKYSFPIVTDSDLSIGNLYNVQTIPQTFLIDENGVITDFIEGTASENSLIKIVESALAD